MFRSKTFLYVCPSESLSSLLLSISLQWWRKSDLFLCFWLEVQSDIMLIAANLITTKYRPHSNIQFVVRKFTYVWWVDFVVTYLRRLSGIAWQSVWLWQRQWCIWSYWRVRSPSIVTVTPLYLMPDARLSAGHGAAAGGAADESQICFEESWNPSE